MSEAAKSEQWVAFRESTDEPLTYTGSLGTYVPVWNNPMSAHDWAQSLAHKPKYYVREVEMLYLAKRE